MPTTTHFNIPTYNSATDGSTQFETYANSINGIAAGSAMNIIDLALYNLSALVTTSTNGLMLATDKVKLNGIEAGATGDMTPTEIINAVKSLAGTGSGLDADLLDGFTSSYFLDWTNTTNKPLEVKISSVAPATTHIWIDTN
jgi:hypothetical protein